jgi:hypothetical protein
LSGPVLSDPKLTMFDPKGEITTRAVKDLLPSELNDLFEGDQLVLLGQYQGEAPLRFKISGNYLGTPRSFEFKFNVDNATTRNSYVPRLWANRKIAYLIDQIRQMGADRNQSGNNARTKELVDEIVRLSTKFGILTEYTSFLATEENLAVNGRQFRAEAVKSSQWHRRCFTRDERQRAKVASHDESLQHFLRSKNEARRNQQRPANRRPYIFPPQ